VGPLFPSGGTGAPKSAEVLPGKGPGVRAIRSLLLVIPLLLAALLAAGMRYPVSDWSLAARAGHYMLQGHLDVFVNGKPVAVPAGIGINITDPGVKAFTDTPDGSTAYGGITGCGQPCISPLHTHDNTGIVHTESATAVPNTLGQFFTEWGVPLTSSCVGTHCSPEAIAFYINGSAYNQDPRDISLVNKEEIAVVIGTPPAHIPDTADFSKA